MDSSCCTPRTHPASGLWTCQSLPNVIDVSTKEGMGARTGRRRALPTVEELRIWRDFIEATGVLLSDLVARPRSESSLSPGGCAVLLAPSDADGCRLRPSAPAARIGRRRSRLSHQLGRTERRGLL